MSCARLASDQSGMNNILDLVQTINKSDPWGNALMVVRSHHDGRTTMAPIQQVSLLGSQVPQILLNLDGGASPKLLRKHSMIRELMVCLQRAPMSELAIQLPDRAFAQVVTSIEVEDAKGMLILDVK